jgi:integrase
MLGPVAATESTLLTKLTMAVRPEFSAGLIRIDPGSPVFARGRCQVLGCERGAWTRMLCNGHYGRWRTSGRSEMAVFAATTGLLTDRSDRIDAFDLRGLTRQVRLEIAYSIQCRHDERTVRLIPMMINRLVALVTATQVNSLLDHDLPRWMMLAHQHGLVDTGGRAMGQLRYGWRHLRDLAENTDAETEFARDVWRGAVLGARPSPKLNEVRFDSFPQPWLRQAVKRACRYRLGAGKAFGSISIDERALRWFATFLAVQHPEVAGPDGITREVLEHYLSWITAAPELSGNTTNTYLVVLRGFLQACHRHGWMPGLPPQAALYLDELPPRPSPLPRFIPEFVMIQLEDPAHLDRLPDETTRHLVVLIQETGLRANDACGLAFNPVIFDSAGWPCLKFHNTKMATEQLIPLSQRAADAVSAQQQHLRGRWPDGCPRLFPSTHSNPDGARGFSYATLRKRLSDWQDDISLHDETGQRVSVTAHQFRHTLGTRLINAGVPQHVVQKMLGHASPQMTARYATIHDATVRAAFDGYQQRRVDAHGRVLPFDPDGPSADAEWIKHNLARVQASLPNGYCGRPPQQHCPHPNACLTCPDFQTTPTFLPIHRRQRDDTMELIDLAGRRGNTRLLANHQQVLDNLDNIITALAAIEETDPSQ